MAEKGIDVENLRLGGNSPKAAAAAVVSRPRPTAQHPPQRAQRHPAASQPSRCLPSEFRNCIPSTVPRSRAARCVLLL
jgi:hypothetical protein